MHLVGERPHGPGALLAVVTLLALAACESSSPTAPTSGTLQVTLTASIVRMGDTATATAVQAGAPVGATWSSSDGSVATVSATGVITARRAGRATITATTGTASGAATVRVVPDFAGSWAGPLFRAQVSCAPASAAPVCVPGTPPATLLAPATLSLTQTGGDVSGTLVDGVEPLVTIPLQGRVADDDVLVLDGGSTVPPLPAPQRRTTIAAFRATYDPTRGTLSGSFSVTVVRVAADGSTSFDHSFQAQFRDLPRR
jgi:hypothetical protein